MKKALKSVLLFMLVVVMAFSVVPTAFAGNTSQNKSTVYKFLTKNMGLNRAAACGIMANIERESVFNPRCVITDSNGLLSGGLCRWNGSRFSALKKFCADNGYDYLSTIGRLNYLKKELNGGYSGILKRMKEVANNVYGAYDAGYYWCYYFEVPANRSSKSVSRGNLARKYYNNYTCATDIKAPSVKARNANGKFSYLGNIKFSWGSCGADATSYLVQIAKFEKNAYDWKKATSMIVSDKSVSMPASELGIGKYAIKVTARDDGAIITKVGKAVKFEVVCADHNYSAKVTKNATDKKDGNRLFTCSICGKKVNVKIANGSRKAEKLKAPTVSAEMVSSTNARINFKTSSKVDGFNVYVKGGDRWFKLGSVPGSETTMKFGDMYKGAKIKVVAFKTIGTKTSTVESKTVTVK